MSRIGFADNEESVEEIRKIAGLENVGIEECSLTLPERMKRQSTGYGPTAALS